MAENKKPNRKPAAEPTDRFKVPCNEVLNDLDGKPMKEGDKAVTLGLVLSAAMLGDAKPEGVTMKVQDRLFLARKFKAGKPCEVKIATFEAVKKIVALHFEKAPLYSGQALELMGESPSEDL